MMKKNYQTRVGDNPNPGLYIEIKEYAWYKQEYGMDLVTALYDTLAKYGIDTVEGATRQGIPVIIQAFDKESLV